MAFGKGMKNCNISVVIPTFNRPDQLLNSLDKVLRCNPKPDEIIVHVDGNDAITETLILNSQFKNIKIIWSDTQIGPGGGRNKAITLAKNAIVASFDDDSYPIDSDYFARLIRLFHAFPNAAVIGSAIYHQNEAIATDEMTTTRVADFVGCGCAYRKEVFQQTSGYVQLPVAYGMEEVDLALRLHNMGWEILKSSWLRVFHDSKLEHHSSPRITAASVANQALLAYLRYPLSFWWLGLVQCISRIIWLVRHRRIHGILEGVLAIPGLLQQYHNQRQLVSPQALLSYLRLRKIILSTPLNMNRNIQ